MILINFTNDFNQLFKYQTYYTTYEKQLGEQIQSLFIKITFKIPPYLKLSLQIA